MVIKIMYLHSLQMQTILVVSYQPTLPLVEMQTFLTNLLHKTLKCTFRKENFLSKNEKLKGRKFLQLFVETSPNKLSALPKKDNK